MVLLKFIRALQKWCRLRSIIPIKNEELVAPKDRKSEKIKRKKGRMKKRLNKKRKGGKRKRK